MPVNSGGFDDIYTRRTDRDPNDANFGRLASEDRVLVSELRSAVQGARSRIDRLRDDAEARSASLPHQLILDMEWS